MSEANTTAAPQPDTEPRPELAPLSLRPAAGDLAGAGRSLFHGTPEQRREHARAMARRKHELVVIAKALVEALTERGYDIVPRQSEGNGD